MPSKSSSPCLAPRCFSTIIVRKHLLLVTAILPVSLLRLTPCALAVLASVIILTLFFLHLHLPAQHSSTLNMLTKSRFAISCRPQCWLTAQSLCLSASRSCTFSRWGGFSSICTTRHSLISSFHIFLTNFDCLAYKPRGESFSFCKFNASRYLQVPLHYLLQKITAAFLISAK